MDLSAGWTWQQVTCCHCRKLGYHISRNYKGECKHCHQRHPRQWCNTQPPPKRPYTSHALDLWDFSNISEEERKQLKEAASFEMEVKKTHLHHPPVRTLMHMFLVKHALRHCIIGIHLFHMHKSLASKLKQAPNGRQWSKKSKMKNLLLQVTSRNNHIRNKQNQNLSHCYGFYHNYKT